MAMAAGLSGAIACVIFVILIPIVSAGDNNCKSYRDLSGTYFSSQTCTSFCCGSCNNRYCCRDSFWRLTEDKQEDCYESMDSSSSVVIGSSVASAFILIVIFISCCVCPCCCIYKMCRKPQPVIATTTHTTVVTHTPQHYPQQPRASPGVHVQSYQGGPYPGYQPIQPGYSAAQPIQPGYSAAQPMPQAYGAQPAQPAQPMPQAYGAQPAQPAQPMPPAAAYPGYTPGPPPPYQEAMGPSYGPSPMAYSQAAFSPGQPPYPLQPPDQPYAQANAPPAEHGQPAFNPAYAHPPPKTGY